MLRALRDVCAWLFFGGATLSSAGCTLLIDTDALTNGRGVGAGGASGQAGATGTGSKCVPGEADASCDGLDAQCQPTLQEACPVGCSGSTLGGTSYMACTTSAPFSQAEVLCQAQHMHLVEIDDASENGYVVQLAQSLGSYVWIGGSDLEHNGTFVWVGGAAFYAARAPIEGVYQNFAADEPASVSGRHCVHLHDDPPGYWLATNCTNSEQFICERY